MALRHPVLVRFSGFICALVLAGVAILVVLAPVAAADVPNPPWQQQCPQRIVLVLDVSESMESNIDSAKESARNLIDALRDAPNEVAVVTFGTHATVAVPATDVSAEDARRQAKKDVGDLEVLRGELGATNWDAALTTAHGLSPDIVILLTDGLPTVHGRSATGGMGHTDPEHLNSAVRASDALKSGGSRVVGLGIGLQPEHIGNLAAVTGPTAGDDFYPTATAEVRDKMYEVASNACGIPVAALPLPEPNTFPLVPVILSGVGVVLLAAVGGLLLSRRRPTIAMTSAPSAPPLPSLEERARPTPRRISLSRLHDTDTPNHPE